MYVFTGEQSKKMAFQKAMLNEEAMRNVSS